MNGVDDYANNYSKSKDKNDCVNFEVVVIYFC